MRTTSMEKRTDPSATKRIRSQLLTLSLPTMFSYALQGVYDLVDMAWVGQISDKALSGVTLFSIIYQLFGVMNEIAGSSSVSMISQSYGRGTHDRTQRIAEQTISFKVVLGVISGLCLAVFIRPLLNFYTKDPEVIQMALSYGTIRILFLPIQFSSYSVNTIFRCTNNTKTPMVTMMIAAVVNCILDPLFMFDVIPGTSIPGLGLGAYGAGLATIISTIISFSIGFFILISGRYHIRISWKGVFSLDREIDRELLLIGMPSGLQLMIRQAFSATMVKFVSLYGAQAIAVSGLASKLTNFGFMPLMGLNWAGSALVGQAIGREDTQEVHQLVRIATQMIVGIVFCLVLPVAIFPEFCMRLFSSDPTLLKACVPMVRWISLGMLIASASFGRRTAFSGSGYNRPQMVSTLVSCWCVQLPLMFLLVQVLQVPLDYFWTATVVANCVDYGIVSYFYNKGEWLKRRVG